MFKTKKQWVKEPLEAYKDRKDLTSVIPGLFIPLDGADHTPVPTISQIMARVQSGQFVDMLADGDSIEDQVFDSEYMDRFEVLDHAEQWRQSKRKSDGAEAEIHNSGAADPEEPSLNSGADSDGN